jgi:hypothetical protein
MKLRSNQASSGGSSAGPERTEPNRLIVLLYAGVVSLTVGVVALGVGLLTA